MRKTFSSRPRSAGFSLVELMVSLVAGLIVSGAVLTFTVVSLRSSSEFVSATRLTQELRAAMDFTGRELRRAGFDEASMDYVAIDVTDIRVSPFSPILVEGAGTDSGCLVYAYDRLPGDPGVVNLDNGEIRAIRRVEVEIDGRTIGVLEAGESSDGVTPACDDDSADYTNYPPTCEGAWCALTDPRIVDIQSFAIDTSASQTFPGAGTRSPMLMRVFDIDLRGALVRDPDTVRGVQSTIRVRSDCLRALLSDCEAAPTGI